MESMEALLSAWRPEEHADLARMIGVLAREFFIDTDALRVGGEARTATL